MSKSKRSKNSKPRRLCEAPHPTQSFICEKSYGHNGREHSSSLGDGLPSIYLIVWYKKPSAKRGASLYVIPN